MISLFTAEGLAGLFFLFIVAVTVSGGLIAINSPRLPRAVAGLALCFIGIFDRDLWTPDEPRVAAISLEMSRLAEMFTSRANCTRRNLPKTAASCTVRFSAFRSPV